MTIFDFIMEPAAVKLNYWIWLESSNTYVIPLKNYICWFGFGSIFSFILFTVLSKNSENQLEKLLLENNYFQHFFIAQLIYFIMIYFA
jgi:uncharacterized membrane protein